MAKRGEQQGAIAAVRYDLGELRRCLAFSCSASEIAEIAAQFGVYCAGVAPGPGAANESARLLLRELEPRDRLDELVAWLRTNRPLVEWPEPLAEPMPVELVPISVPPPLPSAPPGRAAAPPLPARLPPPGKLPPAHTQPTDVGPRTDAGEVLPAPAAPAPPKPLPGPVLLDPFAMDPEEPRSPGAGTDSPRGQREMRIALGLGVGGVLLATALVGGFLWGRGRPEESPGATASGSAAPGASAASGAARGALTRLAADELGRAVGGVAEDCGVLDRSGPSREVLALAFQNCGRAHHPPSGTSSPAAAPSDTTGGPSGTSATGPAAEPRPERTPAAPAQGGCMQRCGEEHRQCRTSECGPEPTSGSKYDDYQKCLTHCLSKAAQCRRRCG